MTRKSKSSKHTWIDRDDGPRLTAAMARRGQVSESGRIIRPASGVLVNDRLGKTRITLRKASRTDAAGKPKPK